MNPVHNKLILAFDAKRLFNNFTGLGNYSRTLVKNLQERYPQHEYHLFTPKITKHEETDYFLDSKKFTVHQSLIPLWRTFGIPIVLKKIKADIFHGLSHEIPYNIPKSTRKVVTFHDLIYEVHPGLFGLWDRNMYKLKYRFAARHADVIVSISENTKRDLLHFYKLPESKIKVIYQSCHQDFQHETPANPAPFLKEKNYYLYVGSIIPRKNLLNIVKAYALLDESHRKPFVVVGSGPDDYLRQVENEINKNNLERYFFFIQRVANNRLVDIYNEAYALIYPSIYEGFGIPVIESLFRKKPVITSNLSSLPEAAGPGGLCIDPYSVKELTKAFIELNNPSLYTSLSQSGYRYVYDHFSSEITAKHLMDLYLEMMQRPG